MFRNVIRKISFLIMVSLLHLMANGVCIVNAENGEVLHLLNSDVNVTVENQVAVVQTKQIFKNITNDMKNFKYAFPLAENESATQLEWKIAGTRYRANIAPTAQDTTLPGPGGSIDANLKDYLGKTPLYFNIETLLPQDSTIEVELTYVSLLEYKDGQVRFFYPNNYHDLSDFYLNNQRFTFHLKSGRKIDDLQMLNHTPDSLDNNGYDAHAYLNIYESKADQDYEVIYRLNADELGLFAISSMISRDDVPDNGDPGFFIFVAEPDNSANGSVVEKVFTLVIDCSGSMSGNRITQAKSAASFIVQNLNEGDKFNIIDFSTTVHGFWDEPAVFNQENEQVALDGITALNATGGTDISGALVKSVEQYLNVGTNTANIIIFFTDGEPTAGLTDPNDIEHAVQDAAGNISSPISLFTFGIGNYVNEQLLTKLAVAMNGLSEFLGDDEVESRISSFYIKIRNPVLINTELMFSPNIISAACPSQLPNLYKGQQLIVSGRYSEAAELTIQLKGFAFGQAVQYSYPIALTDSVKADYQFLTKIWAKQKIEDLMLQYHSYPEYSTEAANIKDEIIQISLLFRIITDFTSFSGGEETEIKQASQSPELAGDVRLLGNYPNPFNSTTRIRLSISHISAPVIVIRIYDIRGSLVRTLYAVVNASGEITISWDGRSQNGELVPTGTYLYVVNYGNSVRTGKMILLK